MVRSVQPPALHERGEGLAELPSPVLLWLQLQVFALTPSINCAENKEKDSRREVRLYTAK